ncbi:MAG: hypothetical protein ACQETB_05300 [Halobacteriota archaeon]
MAGFAKNDGTAPVYVTRGLLAVLLEHAESNEPGRVSISLASTPASAFGAALEGVVDPDTPIVTDMYIPDAGRSVNSVFGMDLARPAGGASAKFVSHPNGPLAVTKEDDLAGVVLVAVPPWDDSSVAAFGRSGTHLELVTVDAEPPVDSIE